MFNIKDPNTFLGGQNVHNPTDYRYVRIFSVQSRKKVMYFWLY